MKTLALLILFPVCGYADFKLNPYTNQKDYYEPTAAIKASTGAIQTELDNLEAGLIDVSSLTVVGYITSGSTITAAIFDVAYTTVTATCAAATTCTATCASSYKVINGSCTTNPKTSPKEDYINTDTTWKCDTNASTTITVRIRCGRIL